MALYDNKLWLLSHIRNSFISTDDTGMCELVMLGEDITKQLEGTLEIYPESSDSEDDDDDIGHESFDIRLDTDYGISRQRSNTAIRLEKLEQARRKAASVKHVKWESSTSQMLQEDLNELFVKKELKKPTSKKSLLTEQLEKSTNLPQNPYMQYAKFDGSAVVGVPVKKYRIFLTMLPEEKRNFPINICCIGTAKIHDLIGLILLKCSTMYSEFPLQPVTNYGLYITEEDGEVDRDFPCLEPKEVVDKFGFSCLGLVEHKHLKNVSFENTQAQLNTEPTKDTPNKSYSNDMLKLEESKQLSADIQMKVHTTAMEAPFYRSYRVYIVSKVRPKIEIHLGISGDKIEIDPVQQKSSKFPFVKQKAVTHDMDSVAWCKITDTRSSRTVFKLVYSTSSCDFGTSSTSYSSSIQASTSFKHYDFETDHATAEEIVQKINLILDLRSSASRKEYLMSREKKHKKKGFLT